MRKCDKMSALNSVCAEKFIKRNAALTNQSCSGSVALSQIYQKTVAFGRFLFTFTLPSRLTGQIQ